MDKHEGTVAITVSPENRVLILGAGVSGMLGNEAYQRVVRLDASHLRILSTWAGLLADIKEQIESEVTHGN